MYNRLQANISIDITSKSSSNCIDITSKSSNNCIDVTRVPAGTSLLEQGVLVEKIDNEIPTLYDCLAKILEPQMIPTEWEKLYEAIPMFKKIKRGTCVFLLSEKAIAYYNCMISNIHTDEEKSSPSQLIYTDDEDFNIHRLPRITNKCQFEELRNGIINYIKHDKTYVVKTTSVFKSGINHNKTIRTVDYLFYIPRSSIFKIN